MNLKGLYGVTDGSTGDELIEKAHKAILGGLSVLQYRDKTHDSTRRLNEALKLRELCCQHQVLFIINDDIELARHVYADGIHLGRDDISPMRARYRLGPEAIIGVSCYNQLGSAIEAEKQGADYVAFGACFPSSTKPEAVTVSTEILQQAKERLSVPVCAIGGITTENAQTLILNQVDMIAVINGLFASDDITATASQFSAMFASLKYH
jgi:thiamine-phosphate pyrophosphorylase